jgi:putative ABC transport system substrate-binding protein
MPRASDFPAVLDAVGRDRPDALFVLDSALHHTLSARILEFAAKQRLPVISGHREFVVGGALLSYGRNIPDQYRRVAEYVDKVLRGAKPADLPIAQAATFDLIVNLKTAKALGVTIPPSLLLRAEEVIE